MMLCNGVRNGGDHAGPLSTIEKALGACSGVGSGQVIHRWSTNGCLQMKKMLQCLRCVGYETVKTRSVALLRTRK